jgi:hypothetical protein
MNTSELGTNGQSQSMTESNAVINKPTNLIDLLKSKFKGNSQ